MKTFVPLQDLNSSGRDILEETAGALFADLGHSLTRRNYDRLSRWYDLLEGNWERKPREAALAGLDACPGCRVLEIGCGTGNSLEDLYEMTAGSGLVYGVDLSMGMLKQARKRLLKEKTAGHALLIQADAILLPFPNESLNIIFLSFTLELFGLSEIPVVLAECRRVLKPGARLGVVAVSKSGGGRWMVPLYERLHQAFPRVVDCAPINLRTLLEESGFSPLSHQIFSLFGVGVGSVIAGK